MDVGYWIWRVVYWEAKTAATQEAGFRISHGQVYNGKTIPLFFLNSDYSYVHVFYLQCVQCQFTFENLWFSVIAKLTISFHCCVICAIEIIKLFIIISQQILWSNTGKFWKSKFSPNFRPSNIWRSTM